MSIAALALSLWLLLADTKFDRTTTLSLAAIALLCQPLRSHFYYAQSQLIVLFFLILMFRSIDRGRDLRAGVFLSIPVLLRVFPIVLAGFLVVRREWMALAGCFAGVAIGLLVAVGVVGLRASLNFARAIPFVTSAQYLYRPANVAFMSLVLRGFVYAGIGPTSPLPRVAGLLLEIGLLGVTIALTMRASDDHRDELDTFALWIVTMIAIAPTAWDHYMVLLYIPFSLIALGWVLHEDAKPAGWLAITSYCLMPFGGLLMSMRLTHPLMIAARETSAVSLLVMYASVVCLVRDARA